MIHVFKNPAELSKTAAELFAQAAREAVRENGRFTVALTGGSSPVQLYTLLTQKPYVNQIPWEKLFVFWGDERWVPLTDDRSNYKMALDTLLSKVPVLPSQIYPMWSKEASPEEFAQQYENQLHQQFNNSAPQFDLILLGMGDDGHTASLFPGTSVLEEKDKWVQAYFLEPQQMHRITLTAPLINQAKKILFLTYGEKKAHALYEVLEGERNPTKYPSQLIQPQQGETRWLVDDAAAKKLLGQA